MNGIEFGALRQLFHMSREDAAKIIGALDADDIAEMEAGNEEVPPEVVDWVRECIERFRAMITLIPLNFDPDEILAGIDEALSSEAPDVSVDPAEPLSPGHLRVKCLTNAAIGYLALNGDLLVDGMIPRTPETLRRVRMSMFHTVHEAALHIGKTTDAKWRAYEAGLEAVPLKTWEAIDSAIQWRQSRETRADRTTYNDLSALIDRIGKGSWMALWYTNLEDIRRFAGPEITLSHLRLLQSATAQMLIEQSGKTVLVPFDFADFTAFSEDKAGSAASLLVEWVKQVSPGILQGKYPQHSRSSQDNTPTKRVLH